MKLTRQTIYWLVSIILIVLIIDSSIVVIYRFYQLIPTFGSAGTPKHYENLTMEEARALAPFQICLPSHLPAEANPTPVIEYLDIWRDGYVLPVVQYRSQGTSERWPESSPLVQIRQWYQPQARPINLPDLHDLRFRLVVWQVGMEERERFWDEIVFDVARLESNGVKTWFVEITEPAAVRGTAVTWTVPSGEGEVTYEVFSVLNAEETLRITGSMCRDNQSNAQADR